MNCISLQFSNFSKWFQHTTNPSFSLQLACTISQTVGPTWLLNFQNQSMSKNTLAAAFTLSSRHPHLNPCHLRSSHLSCHLLPCHHISSHLSSFHPTLPPPLPSHPITPYFISFPRRELPCPQPLILYIRFDGKNHVSRWKPPLLADQLTSYYSSSGGSWAIKSLKTTNGGGV